MKQTNHRDAARARFLSSYTVNTLFENLQQGGRAVASSRRLARQVERRYADWQTRRGQSVWPAPTVEHYDEWLHRTWQLAFEHDPDTPWLLTDDQELLLWEQVIQRSQSGGHQQYLMQVPSTARAARRSWRRMHDWRLSWTQLRRQQTADTAAFLEWASAVQAVLDERGWLAPAQLAAYLAEHPESWVAAQPQTVWWMGFDALPDAHARLRELLEAHHSRQYSFDTGESGEARAAVVECRDPVEQWTRIARWARASLEENPALSLGVVCPDLHARREDIEDILEDVLHPELAWRADTARAYHLSLGRPLPEYPVAGAALDVLQWHGSPITFDAVSRVLRSPYVAGGEAELGARADLEARLRKLQQSTFTLGALRHFAERQDGLETFVRCLDAAIAHRSASRGDANARAAELSEWLVLFGWPGDRPLDRRDFQVVSAWHELLSRFAALNTVQDQWSRKQAVNKLASMASARILQFHDDDAPLQIMGAAEAPGLWFDALWLADMSDATWPPPAQPDPFIPVSLQKACGMPEASAPSMMTQTRARTDHLLASAPQVYVSYASREDNAPATLSPLFDGQAAHPASQAAAGGNVSGLAGRTGQLLSAAPGLDTIADHQAPPVEGRLLRGGVSLVADQALCPFRALAHHRLRARELDDVTPGLSPAQRGELAHDVLKRFWDDVVTQEALIAMSDAEVQRHAAACVAAALESCFADSPFQTQLLELESERLTALLLEWLALERRRGSFRVLATEAEERVVLDQAQFDVRVDRIDQLPDGRRLIIDYKTGQLVNVRVWGDDRIEEPQLPMYALAIGDAAAALALAGVRRGSCELRGIADDDVEGLESLTPVADLGAGGIDELKAGWAGSLGERVAEHRRGVATVDPKHAQACRYCDAAALCRIFERPGWPD